ncbi:MAG: OmpA family protein [Phycisphaerales bacterium]|nr:OmpA family protein [Phycisphaerae bacterium]NNF41826.1 OmpA family protein [Phycisphaerales bacterium]NNM25432.1 OmpA family protein [Phycisphaerales bacterium]
MRRIFCLTAVVALAASFLGTGCAPQDRYDHLITANRSLKEQIVALEQDRDGARADLSLIQGQLDESQRAYHQLHSQFNDLNQSVAGLGSQTDDYLSRITQLEMGPLPVEVETALSDLARRHPELLSFDASQGMVRFASDFTFDLASIEVKRDAQSTITALANILNDSSAAGLEVRVIGHTDNVPIRRAATRAQHPTNVHLSVHRAISVRDALVAAGVDPQRLQVAGYGEFRPVVANGAGGAAANRRVEIYLTTMADGAAYPSQSWQPESSSVGTDPATVMPMK